MDPFTAIIYMLKCLLIMNVIFPNFQISAEFPAYNLFTPTVVDIEGDFSAMEIILGTSAGNLFILDHHGKVKEGWPKSSGSIHGQVTST